MIVSKNQIFYDNLEHKVEVNKIIDENTFQATKYVITVVISSETRKEFTTEEFVTYNIHQVGTILFYNLNDRHMGRDIATNPLYKWNAKHIITYYEEKDRKLLEEIKANAPADKTFSSADRQKLISSYTDQEKQDLEENEFHKKYYGKYFGRMDFDIEYFHKTRPDLLKEHYYNKVYVGKKGTIYDDNNRMIIADWRSPIGGFFSDNDNRFVDPKIDKDYVNNYELIMKRRFSDNGKYTNVFIADGNMFKNGEMDSFLIDVLTRLRRSGNDKAADIIETIQAEQNKIVRESPNVNFYVQGCAGSGKTMILLHRLSWLIYNYKNLDTSKIKIITPNENIIHQLKDLSAQLEISNIEQMTLERYYLYLISNYSSTLFDIKTKNSLPLSNETILSQDFLDYVYSDECIEKLNNNYCKFYDDLFNETKNFISAKNQYNIATLQEYAKELFALKNQLDVLSNKRDELIKQKVNKEAKLKEYSKEYEEQIKSNKTLAKLENTITNLNDEKNFAFSLIDEIKELNKGKRECEQYQRDREKAENFLSTFYYLKEDSLTENISFKSITEAIEAENDNKEKENLIVKTIEKYSMEIDNLTSDLDSRNEEVNNLLDSYNKTAKIHFFRRKKMLKTINSMNKEVSSLSYKLSNIERDKSRKEKELETQKLVSNNVRYNGKLYIEGQIDNLVIDEKKLSAKIQAKENKINSSLKKYKLSFENLDNRLKEIDYEIEENEQKLLNESQILIQIKNNMDEINSDIYTIDNKIAEVFPFDKQQEKNIIKQCNKILFKSENGIYEPKLKITDYRFISDILDNFKTEIYAKYNIELTEKVYKHNLYFILYILTKMYGEKGINSMVNIDEAQDVSINEYKLIQKANCNSVFNLYGDTNQLLFKNRGINNWDSLSDLHLKNFKLNINYRNVATITKYCNQNLSPLAMEVMGVVGEPVKEISINEIENYINNSTYVIVKNKEILNNLSISKEYNLIEKKEDNIDSNKINILTVEMAKGMEFSNVIVIDMELNKREKYVAYTRALNNLIVAK